MAMEKDSAWVWYGILTLGVLLALGLVIIYACLPADGATGDMESLTQDGFRVQWLIDERPEGLQVGDIIVSTEGHPLEDWLQGNAGRADWQAGDTVEYLIIRDSKVIPLEIQLTPLSIRGVFSHWASQSLGSIAFLVIGAYVFLLRPRELEARLFMLFFLAVALQMWGDAYNIQFSTIPQQWPFWLQNFYEFITYHIAVSSITYLALLFPIKHPIINKYPRLIPWLIFLLPFAILLSLYLLSSGIINALENVTKASWAIALIQIFLTMSLGIRSAIYARDPVKRAQIRWILFCATIESAILIPGYVIPILLEIPPLFPHSITNTIIALVPIFIILIIIRFGLFNIQIVVNKTIVYGSVSLILAGLFLLVVRLATLLVEYALQRQNDTLVVFIATLSITLAFNPIRDRFQTLIDRIFYRSKINSDDIRSEFTDKLISSVQFELIKSLLTKELPDKIQISSASLGIISSQKRQFGEQFTSSDETSSSFRDLIDQFEKSPKPILRLQPPKIISKKALDYLERNQFELSIPLFIRGEIIGVYNLGKKLSNDGYNQDEINLLEILGRQATISIENSRLILEKEHQAKLLAGLHQAAVAVSSSLEIDELLEILVKRLGDILDVSRAYICDINLETAQSKVLAEWININSPNITSNLGTLIDLRDFPIIYQSILTNEPFIVHKDDSDLSREDFRNIQTNGLHSCLIIPFVVQKRLIGFMELWETRWERVFTDEDIRICQTLAADAAAALERARLFETEREQRRLAEAIQDAAAVVNSSLELDTVLDIIFGQVEKVVKGDTFNIMLIEGSIAKIIRGHGYDGEEGIKTVQEYRMSIEEFPTLNHMSKTGKALVIPDTSNDPLWTYQEDWQKPQSFIGAPIRFGERTIGFLNVNGNRTNQFTADDALWLETFANTAAAALERARLFQAERDQRMLSEALQKAASILSSSLKLEQVFDHILEQLKTVISGENINIMLIEGDIAKIVRWQGYKRLKVENKLSSYRMPIHDYYNTTEMMNTSKAIFVEDTRLSPHWEIRPDWEWLRSYVGAPIILNGKIAGFINVHGTQPNMFDDEDAARLEVFALHASTAIQNAQLYEKIIDSLEEKEILLKEIHHRVKNNLQIITSLLSLQSGQIKNDFVNSTFQESQNRVHAMAMVHDKLYRSANIARINFGEYIQDLAHYLHGVYRSQHQKVKLEFQVEHISLDIDAAIPCGLILNELISNAFKHAFPFDDEHKETEVNSLLRIELEASQSNQICMKVSSNGVLASKNLDIVTPKSLGLQLVSSLANQISGAFDLEVTDVTIFSISFPLKK